MNEFHYSLYRTPVFGTLLSHFPGSSAFVADYADEQADDRKLQSLARIKSGDYLVTVATELDQMAQRLAVTRSPEAPELERLVSELLYLHERFRLAKQ